MRMMLWLWDENGDVAAATRLVAALNDLGLACGLQRFSAGAAVQTTSSTPLILWQGENDSTARVRAFAAGADEIIGPWMLEAEAVARVRRWFGKPAPSGARMQLGPLEINLIDHAVVRDGRPLELLRREYDLLLHLARHAGRIQSRETLLRAIWRLAFDPGTNVVEVHISRLRAKLDRGFAWQMLRTVRGAGYALVTDSAG
jgi:two-component system, OmpR family, response regulator